MKKSIFESLGIGNATKKLVDGVCDEKVSPKNYTLKLAALLGLCLATYCGVRYANHYFDALDNSLGDEIIEIEE